MNAICELAGVSKEFRGPEVISELSLTVSPGEMIAITGPSGSGKSTLLNIIGMLDEPGTGSLRLFGRTAPKPASAAAGKLRRHRIGYLFQNFALIDNETVDYNLRVAQTYAKSSRRDKAAARARALDEVRLGGLGARRVYELSGGEQQRVAIGRLLLKPCELVLADEPTGSLDPGNRDAVLGMLHSLNRDGKTIIIVTHDDKVTGACTRAIELAKSATASTV